MNKFLKTYLLVIFSAISFLSCEDMFKKDIDVDGIDEYPKLYVIGAVEPNDKTFNCYIGMTKPIVYEGTIPRRLGDVSLSLFENDELILQIDTFAIDKNMYIKKEEFDLGLNSKYRLEINVDGFDEVYSEIETPITPTIKNIVFDENITVYRNPNHTYLFDYWLFYSYNYYPLSMQIIDFWSERDYYMLSTELYILDNEAISQLIGTTDYLLVQDNPHVEAHGLDADINTYLFNTLMISDFTFSNSETNLNLLVPEFEPRIYGLATYDYWISLGMNPGSLYEVDVSLYFTIKHVPQEFYDYYRTIVIQGEQSGIQIEPIEVKSNIENGYGCFFSTSAVRVKLFDGVYYTIL